jgi:hypothetical protein
MEDPFLYATLLGDDLVPFGYRRLRLVVLPIELGPDGRARLVDKHRALECGWTGLKEWLEAAEALWEQHKSDTTKQSLLEWLNYRGKLTGQNPGALRVVYTKSGTHLTAAVVKGNSLSVGDLSVAGFVVDHVLYGYEASSPQEAHYLTALLNAPCVDAAIKSSQTMGAFGPRDLHRRPFEVLPNPIRVFNPRDKMHRELAKLSRQCHRKVVKMKLSQSRAIGRLRRKVREDLRDELEKIDGLVKELLGL